LREGRVVGTGIVLTELPQGAKIELETTQNTWIKAGRTSYILRRKGITIPTTDLIIASLALEYDCLIFTLDPHFEKIPDIELYKYS